MLLHCFFVIIYVMNTFSDPNTIVEQFDVLGGQHIADLGAGQELIALHWQKNLKVLKIQLKFLPLKFKKIWLIDYLLNLVTVILHLFIRFGVTSNM